MNLLIVSGLSGAGKSVAMNALEDIGFFCIDNIPAALLPSTRRWPPAMKTEVVPSDASIRVTCTLSDNWLIKRSRSSSRSLAG